MNSKDYGLELKYASGAQLVSDGTQIEGYASLFGLTDQGGDIVQKGAYAASLKRLEGKIRAVLQGARGRSVRATIEELNPVLRGWAAYFKLTETKRALEELDGWLRRKLRCTLWRQWKRPYTRARNLMKKDGKDRFFDRKT